MALASLPRFCTSLKCIFVSKKSRRLRLMLLWWGLKKKVKKSISSTLLSCSALRCRYSTTINKVQKIISFGCNTTKPASKDTWPVQFGRAGKIQPWSWSLALPHVLKSCYSELFACSSESLVLLAHNRQVFSVPTSNTLPNGRRAKIWHRAKKKHWSLWLVLARASARINWEENTNTQTLYPHVTVPVPYYNSSPSSLLWGTVYWNN